MKYDEIMKSITSGLTGDKETDLSYIKEQMRKYKDHELATEILRACGRMMAELIPEDMQVKFSRMVSNDLKGISEAMDEVRYNIYKKDLKKAHELLANIVKTADEYPMFKDDSVSQYFTFNELFEEILYMNTFKPERECRRAEMPFSEIYLLNGSLLYEEEKYMEARETLVKARKWNPVNSSIAFEYMETFKVLGELDKFARLTREQFNFAFSSKDVARCYRNLGFYFVEKEVYDAAILCYFQSMNFDKDSKNAQSELYYIQSKTGKPIVPPEQDEVEELVKKYDIPLETTNNVIGLAFAVAKQMMDDKQPEFAAYMLEIVYDLTGDEQIKDLLDKMKDELETKED